MDEFLKQLSGGVLRLYDAQGEILAVGILPEEVLVSLAGNEGSPLNTYVTVDFLVNVCRDGLACYGLVQTRNGKSTPKLSCGLAGSGAILILSDQSVRVGEVLVIPGLVLTEDQQEFQRQLAEVIEKAIDPKVSANVTVIRAADKRRAEEHENGILEWRSAVEGKTLASNIKAGPPQRVIDAIRGRANG